MGSDRFTATSIDALRERLESYGQAHVLRFWDDLDDSSRERLAGDLGSIDVASLSRVFQRARALGSGELRGLAPPPVERRPERGGDRGAFARAQERGEALLASGRVGVVVVAGGQGTRLGFAGPKGAFPIGPMSDRTLFELLAQKLLRARSRYGAPIPWYVMTSPATDGPTREHFARHEYFGLPPDDVFFFCQGMVPSLDFEGRLMLAAPDRLARNPNGHGGVYTALAESGALDDLRKRDIRTLSYCQVDNPLVRMTDPVFLGFHAEHYADMSCKVVTKRKPEEKMGVVARVDGRVSVVEYTEIDDEHRYARQPDGELTYWCGNVAIHGIEVDFARRVAEHADRALPYHASAKKIRRVDANGRPVDPQEPNGYKLERFVFDALAEARRVAVVEALREEEYSPVKNAEGSDSPATARRDLTAEYRRWLAAAGVCVPDDAPIEIDHAWIDSANDARATGIRRLEEAGDRIRCSRGASH